MLLLSEKNSSSSDLVGWVAKKGLEIVGKSFTKDIGWEGWVIMDDQLRRGLQRQGWASTWNQKKCTFSMVVMQQWWWWQWVGEKAEKDSPVRGQV